MAYEFKKLSDVEVVAEPTESANVLIEENGVIKKAPKTAVGGGGEWDAVFVIDDIYNWTADNTHITVGSFDAIKAKIDAYDLPRILIIASYEYGDTYRSYEQPIQCQYNVIDNTVAIYFYNSWASLYNFVFASDGTITVSTSN